MSSTPSFAGLRGQLLVLAVTLSSGLGFLPFSYDLGCMGGVTASSTFQTIFSHSNPSFLGFLVASYEAGALFGALTIFILGDRFGRRTINVAGVSVISIDRRWKTAASLEYEKDFVSAINLQLNENTDADIKCGDIAERVERV